MANDPICIWLLSFSDLPTSGHLPLGSGPLDGNKTFFGKKDYKLYYRYVIATYVHYKALLAET